MKKNNTQLTSVKVDPELFEEFKVLSIKTKVDFTKLTNRSLYLYITNEEYRKIINNQLSTSLSGSVTI